MPVLHHELVAGSGATPERWIYVLHGIFGAGRNWGSVARRLARSRPDVGAVLVDLREHGGSRGFAPPHTVAAAAVDVAALAAALARPAWGMLGHSFGGKVALAFARDHGVGLHRVWIVDSTPAAHEKPEGSAWAMLRLLRALPAHFESRQALISSLGDHGVARSVAQWMATNLEADDGGYRWRFDLDAMEALLRDFMRVDLWSVVESPPAGCELHFLKARDSAVLGAAELARLRGLEAAGAAVRVHVLPGGHWLNADNPEAVLAILEATL